MVVMVYRTLTHSDSLAPCPLYSRPTLSLLFTHTLVAVKAKQAISAKIRAFNRCFHPEATPFFIDVRFVRFLTAKSAKSKRYFGDVFNQVLASTFRTQKNACKPHCS